MASNPEMKDLGSQYRGFFFLGEGSFGTVKLASHLKTGALVAIKTIKISKKTTRLILSERAALERLSHPNIIRLFQVIITSSHANFVLEYAPGGNLYELIQDDGPLEEEEAKKIFGQIVAAIKYCHNLGLAHRDIKPQNILRDEDGNVKLTDFGLAVKLRPGSLLNGRCGTKGFYAPELVLGEPYDGRKTDVWSLGVLLFFITTGHYPFTGSTLREIENNIVMGTYRIPPYISGQLENLLHQIFTVAPELRPSIEDIERHPWVMKCEVEIPTVTYTDSNIIDMLCGMGFKANEVFESLQKKRFDEKMGTYLLLKEKIHKEFDHMSTTSAKPVNPCPLPPPSPVDSCTSDLTLKRSAREPNCGLLYIQPSGEQGPFTPTLSGHKVAKNISMPSIPLHYPKKKSSVSSCTLISGAVAAPCVCNTILEDKIHLPPEQDVETETSSPPQKIGCFKRLRRRIRDCLSRLCCFPGLQRQKSSKKVAPLTEARCRTK